MSVCLAFNENLHGDTLIPEVGHWLLFSRYPTYTQAELRTKASIL